MEVSLDFEECENICQEIYKRLSYGVNLVSMPIEEMVMPVKALFDGDERPMTVVSDDLLEVHSRCRKYVNKKHGHLHHVQLLQALQEDAKTISKMDPSFMRTEFAMVVSLTTKAQILPTFHQTIDHCFPRTELDCERVTAEKCLLSLKRLQVSVWKHYVEAEVTPAPSPPAGPKFKLKLK